VLTGYKRKQSERSVSLGKLTSPQAINALNQEINVIATDIVKLESDITKHKRALARTELPMFSPEDFELRIKLTAARFKKADKFQKDAIIREMFLKLLVDNEKVASYHWKEPFLSLVEATDIQLGGDAWT
jgi:hypothetical protein